MFNLDVIRYYCKSDDFNVIIEGWGRVIVTSPKTSITFSSFSEFFSWYQIQEKRYQQN